MARVSTYLNFPRETEAAFSFYRSFPAENPVKPVIFQHFNAFFVVFLTPVVVGAFAWLRSRGQEPSAPRKIGIGMVIAVHNSMKKKGGKLVIANVSENIAKLFKSMRLDQHLNLET